MGLVGLALMWGFGTAVRYSQSYSLWYGSDRCRGDDTDDEASTPLLLRRYPQYDTAMEAPTTTKNEPYVRMYSQAVGVTEPNHGMSPIPTSQDQKQARSRVAWATTATTPSDGTGGLSG